MLVTMNGKKVYVCESKARVGMVLRFEELGIDFPTRCVECTPEKTDNGETVYLCCFVGALHGEPREFFMFYKEV